ncbi:50S ribosomal protein L7/L12 (modular protein) [Sphingomonas aurantiaca]|uniref:50S ribosomal protein L7/L12 (Modular protein) n=1 Tax=Sphingomonas aurantiaca TaxID=185949 RepID=A0A5E7ZSM0_9SPHN|nr:50S ribosomal protein L7/L12 (modular protein) [Sphingomonas aurantiaca]
MTSTVAPAASSCALILAASSFDTPSLTALGADSTSVLASVRPSDVIARTSLMTLIFLPPSPVRMTSNSVCSSAAGAAAPPPAAGAATAAAAETPHFSSSSFESSAASRTVSSLRLSTSAFRSAMINLHLGAHAPSVQKVTKEPARSGGFLLRVGGKHARELRCRSLRDRCQLRGRCHDEANDLGTQFVQRGQRCERLHTVDVEGRRAHRPTHDFELVVRLREFHDHLGGRDGIDGAGQTDRTREHVAQRAVVGAVHGDLGKLVLRDLVGRAGVAHLVPKHSGLCDGQAEVARHDDDADLGEGAVQLGYGRGLLITIHAILHVFRFTIWMVDPVTNRRRRQARVSGCLVDGAWETGGTQMGRQNLIPRLGGRLSTGKPGAPTVSDGVRRASPPNEAAP